MPLPFVLRSQLDFERMSHRLDLDESARKLAHAEQLVLDQRRVIDLLNERMSSTDALAAHAMTSARETESNAVKAMAAAVSMMERATTVVCGGDTAGLAKPKSVHESDREAAMEIRRQAEQRARPA